ncbi:P-loop containing nucleoside triphosphate hydrolase protein [Xylariales sp. AK1849]|nr:P-loop containing nucleoside triphosphate hydrolase protein [Xylariales sp. AK1849]
MPNIATRGTMNTSSCIPSLLAIVQSNELITAIGKWYTADEDVMYVYDGGWRASKALWEQVQKTSWDNVILDPKMKRELTEVSGKFFDNRDVYEDYGVPWKRGLIFHGPVGNGKTISIKALMHTLYNRKSKIPSLYVKSAPQTYNIRSVFAFARTMTPCLLVLEDIETIVTPNTRSYFFNEVDGLENNDGILMIATTNYLNRLDPGLSKRPSRFDRKYLFPLPSLEERVLYCEYWHGKLKDKSRIDFPKSLCRPIASIMDEFSFAYMQEAFVATLLVLARGAESKGLFDEGDAFAYDPYDPEKYEFYRVMKAQIKVLREDMGNTSPPTIVAPRCTTPHASEPVDLEAVARQVEQSALRLGMLSLGGPYSDPLETLLVRSDRSRLLESSDSRRDKQYPGSTAMMSQRLPTRDNGVWEWK